jgi:hypothetical protein
MLIVLEEKMLRVETKSMAGASFCIERTQDETNIQNAYGPDGHLFSAFRLWTEARNAARAI